MSVCGRSPTQEPAAQPGWALWDENMSKGPLDLTFVFRCMDFQASSCLFAFRGHVETNCHLLSPPHPSHSLVFSQGLGAEAVIEIQRQSLTHQETRADKDTQCDC